MIDAPHQLRDVFKNQKQCERHENQQHFIAPVKDTQQTSLAKRCHECGDCDGSQQHGHNREFRRQLHAGKPAHQTRSRIRAQGIEAAMGDIEDFEDAKNQRQPERDDEQPGRIGEAVNQNGE